MKVSLINTRMEGVPHCSELPVVQGLRTYTTTPDLLLTNFETPDTMVTSRKRSQSPTSSLTELCSSKLKRKDNVP